MALDGTEDHMIVREAGEFFRRLDVREQINKEVAIVRHEFHAGRLKWTYEDVKNLIQPYPERKEDKVLECIGDNYQLDAEEKPFEDEDQAAVAVSDDESDCEDWDEPAVAGSEAKQEGENDSSCGAPENTAVAVRSTHLSAAAAEQLNDSQNLVAAYKDTIEVLRTYGAVTAVQNLETEMHKELRKQRNAAKENPACADALLELKVARATEERRERAAVLDKNRKEKELSKLRKESLAVKERLNKRKKELMSIECVLETKNAIKRYSPEGLGLGKRKRRWRKRSYEVAIRGHGQNGQIGIRAHSCPEE